MRYFFHIAYHGTNYRGWQRHPDGLGVQQTLETALGKMLKMPVAINGCGRTDAQVHASQFFFHVDLENEPGREFLFRLNKTLPEDIAVFDIIPMDGLPHARFDAVQRTYDYYIHTYKDPFLTHFSSLYLLPKLDLDKMRSAIALLPLYNDYKGFCTMSDRISHTLCSVSSANLFVDSNGDRMRFNISANRFLSKMIRITMNRLLAIGEGKLSVDEFESYLINKQATDIKAIAYPQGLYLSKVTYPYLDLSPRSAFSASMQRLADADWHAV